MKVLALAAALAIGGLAADTARAVTYSVDVTANPFRVNGTPGLRTRALVLSNSGPQNFDGATYSVDLVNLGDSVTLDIYRLAHFQTAFAPAHATPRPTSATFDFGAFGTRTLTGISQGVDDGVAQFAVARDFSTAAVNVGGGQRILIAIADVVFGTVNGVYAPGRDGAAPVKATFTLAAVPLPASGGLALAALAALALLSLRRRVAA